MNTGGLPATVPNGRWAWQRLRRHGPGVLGASAAAGLWLAGLIAPWVVWVGPALVERALAPDSAAFRSAGEVGILVGFLALLVITLALALGGLLGATAHAAQDRPGRTSFLSDSWRYGPRLVPAATALLGLAAVAMAAATGVTLAWFLVSVSILLPAVSLIVWSAALLVGDDSTPLRSVQAIGVAWVKRPRAACGRLLRVMAPIGLSWVGALAILGLALVARRGLWLAIGVAAASGLLFLQAAVASMAALAGTGQRPDPGHSGGSSPIDSM